MGCNIVSVIYYSVTCLFTVLPLVSVSSRNTCWTSEELCIIGATLEYSGLQAQVSLPLEIDCSTGDFFNASDLDLGQTDFTNAYTTRRFEHVRNVSLDGCLAFLNSQTYGFEFLPNCGKILHATIEHFNGDSAQTFHCSEKIQLESLRFENNEISTVLPESFSNLKELHEIYFSRNCLKYIDHSTFTSLPAIELIHIEHEECLSLKAGDFFESTGIKELHLISVKQIPSDLMQHLPDSLRYVVISDTSIGGNEVIVHNPQALRNITITNCSLHSLTLVDPFFTVTHLNISHNSITHLRLNINDSRCSLQTLDLSENNLRYLRPEWMRNLECLLTLNLRGNHLQQVSLSFLFATVPQALHIDLRENDLRELGDDIQEKLFHVDLDRMRILIDQNPWNCIWLLNFTHTHPEKFRIFQFKKYISKINVNGLECRAEVVVPSPKQDTTLKVEESTTSPPLNISAYTFIYGNSREAKRNQRAEALIIVFMLPLGIAVLFLLLYMWIYCQKMFHWSYYRSIPIIGKNISDRTANRFDVVRQIPDSTIKSCQKSVATNENYEIPLHEVSSDCNCTPNGNEIPCKKRYHITYEALPEHPPHAIYEEIVGDEKYFEVKGNHPFYDHLSYSDD